jgi:hypothetical protein
MFGLNALRNAIARLAGALNALADTAEAVNAGVRRQLALDGPVPIAPTTQTAIGNSTAIPTAGATIEAAPLPMPVTTPTRAVGASSASDAPAAVSTPVMPACSGRRRAAAAVNGTAE